MNYDTIKFFNLEDFIHVIEEASITKINNKISCFVTLKINCDLCPECNSDNPIVHGYYEKRITHSVSTGSPCIIIYKARRYKCRFCGKVYYEKKSVFFRKKQVSTYTVLSILEANKRISKQVLNLCIEKSIS
jgi:transposase